MRERVNTITHIIGGVLALIGLIIMLMMAETSIQTISVLIYGGSMVLLYAASSIYHGAMATPRVISILRKWDHAMIFVLIAGTYTPIALLALRGSIGRFLFGFIWVLALTGLILKIRLMSMPRWLSATIYLLLGWVAIFFIQPIYKAVGVVGIVYLFLGGVLYSIGAILYILKFPKKKTWGFGFHEIFHLFILAGSLAHYLLMVRCIL